MLFSLIFFCFSDDGWCATKDKVRLLVVSSYHREYLWSQDTNEGLVAALLEHGYFENKEQIKDFNKNDEIETHKMVLKKLWLDTKRKSTLSEISITVEKIIKNANIFKPDLLLLGDDNAANYIGNEYLDSSTPIVFWGVNGTPVKYGLVDTMEKPGHNVTGVYQAGYLKETIEFFQRIVPNIKTIGVVSDDSETGRAKVKQIIALERKGQLQFKILEVIQTDDFQQWQDGLLKLENKVDGFIVFNHNSLKDSKNQPIDQMVAGRWYLNHIKRPECADELQFVQEGLLCVTDDSGYKQGYEAIKIAIRILEKGEHPGNIPTYAPSRGKNIVNRQRAKQLGIQLNEAMGIEQYWETSKALE